MFEEDFEPTYNKKVRPLIRRYESLLKEGQIGFFEPFEFDTIVDYYLARKQPKNAINAVDYAIEQHPYSALCVFKKSPGFK